jgi:hypothetical protein
VQSLPLADPGLPDLRSASRFLLRVAWLQRWTVLGGMVFGVLELLALGGPYAARWRSWQSA